MHTSPLVSICLPMYNGSKYIAEAVQSVIHQDYPNIEVVISDNFSKDDGVAIATKILEGTSIPFKVVYRDPNGIGANWNNAIQHARGKYIKLLFQDDFLNNGCIHKMVDALENNRSAGMVFCKRSIVYNPSTANDTWLKKYSVLHTHWDFKVTQGLIKGSRFLGSKVLLNQPLNKIGEPPTTLIRKTCFDKLGYFDNSLVQALDLEYWYRIMTAYDLIFIDEELVSFRLHQEQQSSANRNREIKDFVRLPFIMFKRYFWHLHIRVKFRILRDILAITKNRTFN